MTCTITDCDGMARARGWCMKHYLRWRKTGDPLKVKPHSQHGNPTGPLVARIADKVLIGDGCWEWVGAKSANGYGAIRMGGRGAPQVGAHRAVYELMRGPIPDGLQLDHLCRNRACVRPDHLEPVTCKENIRRGHAARRTS